MLPRETASLLSITLWQRREGSGQSSQIQQELYGVQLRLRVLLLEAKEYQSTAVLFTRNGKMEREMDKRFSAAFAVLGASVARQISIFQSIYLTLVSTLTNSH